MRSCDCILGSCNLLPFVIGGVNCLVPWQTWEKGVRVYTYGGICGRENWGKGVCVCVFGGWGRGCMTLWELNDAM